MCVLACVLGTGLVTNLKLLRISDFSQTLLCGPCLAVHVVELQVGENESGERLVEFQSGCELREAGAVQL